MADDDEWNFRKPVEGLPVRPEQLDRYRRLTTELMFCVIGTPVFGMASVWIRPPLRITSPGATLTPPPAWEVLLYQWGPLILFVVAFCCVIWLVVVLMRMAELKKERA
jgi:hypothetical protein